MTEARVAPERAAAEIMAERYASARVVFLAGSVLRGEGTAYSDLDLVIVFESLERAFRESFLHQGWPVEAFVHDPETLRYFMIEVDRLEGVPSLARMIVEGIALPASNEFASELRRMAQGVLDRGPPPLTDDDVRKRRYALTDLVDDLREPRSDEELVGTGASLYSAVADTFLRTQSQWSAVGKSIPRQLRKVDPAFADAHADAFAALFRQHEPALAIRLVENVLKPLGGFLFDGHRLDAPATWRTRG